MPHGDHEPTRDRHPLAGVIDHLAHLLPAQGPISIFIHHNTLHAFEDLPFEDAVERAASQFDCQPFLSEARYRAKIAAGRILAKDVEFVLAEDLGPRGDESIVDVGRRVDLWRRIVLHGIPAASGRALSWLLEETDVLARFRADLPRDARLAFSELTGSDDRRPAERRAVRTLWDACVRTVARAGATPAIDVRPAHAPSRSSPRGVGR
jgi:hypothetical protein